MSVHPVTLCLHASHSMLTSPSDSVIDPMHIEPMVSIRSVLKTFFLKLLCYLKWDLSNQATLAPTPSWVMSDHPVLMAYIRSVISPDANELLFTWSSLEFCIGRHIILYPFSCWIHPIQYFFEFFFFVSCFARTEASSIRPKIINLTNLISPINYMLSFSDQNHNNSIMGSFSLHTSITRPYAVVYSLNPYHGIIEYHF